MIGKLYALSETRGHFIAQIFRVYMGLYGLGLLAIYQNICLTMLAIYLLVCCVYIFLSFKVMALGVKTLQWSSLIADTLFVDFFAYLYGCFDTYSLTFALLPIFGNVCLSDLHFSKYIAITVPVSLYIILSLVGYVGFISLISPFLIVGIIVLFGEVHAKFQSKILLISERMDSFFTNKENLLNSYRIYDDIIHALRCKPLPISINAIYCFLNIDRLYLYNGSEYVWSYRFENENTFHDEPSVDGIIVQKNIPLVLNDQRKNTFRGYNISIENGPTYMFVVDAGNVGVVTRLLMDITLQTFFKKLAKLYESERLQRNLESDRMTSLSEKANYVNAAVSSMHFMRNKLSPMKTLFSIIDDLKSETDEDRKAKMQEYIYRDIDKMRDSFNLMINRANLLLDKSDTPFVYKTTQKFTLKELFTEIRRSWQDYRLEESTINIDLQKNTVGDNCNVFYNREGMGLVLDNWISNISKYHVGSYSLELVENEQNVILKFANGYDSSKSIDFVGCYSNDDRAEINKNRWHGLANIKDFLDQMNIQGEISNDKDNIYLTITLTKIVDDEEGADN